MKTQISRNSRDGSKRYSGVYQQQGRMLTDADWNELGDIVKERLNDALSDVVGSGSPKQRGVIGYGAGADSQGEYFLKWGRAYADGIIAELAPDDPAITEFDYLHQADYPQAPAQPEQRHLLYLDIWDRTVVSLEDVNLRDAGLHGADTCSRTQTMTQLKWCPLDISPLDTIVNPQKGNATVTLTLRQASVEQDPCDPCSDELQLKSKVGNYLFRVEVHLVTYDDQAQADTVTLKWSSENGAEHYQAGIEPVDFDSDQFVYEYFSQDTEKLLGRHLADNWQAPHGILYETHQAQAPLKLPLVRRWDGYARFKRQNSGIWKLDIQGSRVYGKDKGLSLSTTSSEDQHGHVIEGESVSIQLSTITLVIDLKDKQLLSGDYWLAAVREAVHVPGYELLSGSEPQGVLHHYFPIAETDKGVFAWPESEWTDPKQLRALRFPALTNLQAVDIEITSNCVDLYGNATNLQQVLDELCDINATDIAYESACDALKDTHNVKEALDKLCSLDGLNTCSVPVGVGGVFPTLDDALTTLQGAPVLSLCLLPGEHRLSRHIQWEGLKTIRLFSGGNEAATLRVGGANLFASEVYLNNLFIYLDGNKQLEIRADCIDVQGCAIQRIGSSRNAIAMVKLNSNIRGKVNWENNRMTTTWRNFSQEDFLSAYSPPTIQPKDPPEFDTIRKTTLNLVNIDPIADQVTYENTIKNLSAEIGNLTQSLRETWNSNRPQIQLPFGPKRNLTRATSSSSNGLMIKEPLQYKDSEGANIVADKFFNELKKRTVDVETLKAILDDAFMSLNESDFGDSLAFATFNMDGVVEKCFIQGNLVFNTQLAGGINLANAGLTKSSTENTSDYVVEKGNFRISENEIVTIKCKLPKDAISNNGTIQRNVDGFSSLNITGNYIKDIKNGLIGAYITFSGNQLQQTVKDDEATLFILGYKATITGNMSTVNKSTIIYLLHDKDIHSNLSLTFPI